MNPFESLGPQTENLWRNKAYDYAVFPELALSVLSDFKYSLDQSGLDQALAEWFIESPIPEQVNLHNNFGQPPVTLFNNGKFVVEAYIWLNFDTSLHSHGFRGAFRVLHGSSLHEEYAVKTLDRIAPDVQLTELGLPKSEILLPGDIRPIAPGQELSHRVIHLENPTVTLCVKTINEPSVRQWNYFANGLAIQKRAVPESLVKSIYYFQYLCTRDEERAAKFLFEILNVLEISMQMNLFEEIAAGTLDLSEETAHFILETITARFSKEEWLKLYDGANLGKMTELDFSVSDLPLARLAGHAVNTGMPPQELRALAAKLLGRAPGGEEIEAAVDSLADAATPAQLKALRKILN